MPNARPTQPGYYWARMRTYRHAAPTWQPVELAEEWFLGSRTVYIVSDDVSYSELDVDEWGPAIPEYRGEAGG